MIFSSYAPHPPPPPADERVREASRDEEALLFDAMPAQWHPLLRFYLRQLVREKTAIALTFDRIDWGARSFTFVGKGNKVKTLPLADDIRDELWALQAPGARRVFRYPNGDPMTVSGFVSAFRRAREKAGIKDFRPHDLRHTGASRTLRKTGNLKLVQRLLTHKDIVSTVKYAHVLDEDLRVALNAMAEPAPAIAEAAAGSWQRGGRPKGGVGARSVRRRYASQDTRRGVGDA